MKKIILTVALALMAKSGFACFGTGWRAELYVDPWFPLEIRGVAAAAGGVEEIWVNVAKSTDGDLDIDCLDTDTWTTLPLDAHGSQFLYDRQIGTVEGGGRQEARLLTATDSITSQLLEQVTGQTARVGDVFLFKIGMKTINYGDIGTRADPYDNISAPGGSGSGMWGTVRAEMLQAVTIQGVRPFRPQ